MKAIITLLGQTVKEVEVKTVNEAILLHRRQATIKGASLVSEDEAYKAGYGLTLDHGKLTVDFFK